MTLPPDRSQPVGPAPDDIFREYVYDTHKGRQTSSESVAALDPGAGHPLASLLRQAHEPEEPLHIDIGDLEGATRAEVAVEYWGGHLGTSQQSFRINGHEWIDIPQPQNTPQSPLCFYRTLLGNPPVPIDLSYLRPGDNIVQFRAGPQICHSFDLGFYWIYAFTIRVYYDARKKHPKGRIVAPSEGTTVGENPSLLVEATSDETVATVDWIGHYEDYDWAGNGSFRGWHYQLCYGEMRRHLGTATCAPFALTWDTTWVPDQDQSVRLMARIRDTTGVYTMSREVRVRLQRRGRSVRMVRSHDVPEALGVRMGERKTCTLEVSDSLEGAQAARLVLSTWSAAHADDIGLNGVTLCPRVGRVHDYSYDSIHVPLDVLKQGRNVFHIFATTEHHAAEINWPGPILLIEYAV